MSDTPTIPRVRSRADLDAAIRRAGELDHALEKERHAEARAKQKITARHAATIAALEEQRAQTVERIRAFVAENTALVFGDKRSAVTEAGEIAVKKLPVRLVVDDEAAAVQHLTDGHMDAYLRRDVALDKRALLKDRPPVPGLDYAEREQLVIVPITSGDRIAVEL